jgi:hypothetical protein
VNVIYDSARPVQVDPDFGALPYQERCTYYEPSPEDAAWAAALFEELDQARYAAARDRELEEQAEQDRWDDQFRFPPGVCESCGQPSDRLDDRYKLCPECLTAAENASIACQYRNAMGQYRTF